MLDVLSWLEVVTESWKPEEHVLLSLLLLTGFNAMIQVLCAVGHAEWSSPKCKLAAPPSLQTDVSGGKVGETPRTTDLLVAEETTFGAPSKAVEGAQPAVADAAAEQADRVAAAVELLSVDATAVAAAVVQQLDPDALWQAHLHTLSAEEIRDEIRRVSAQLAEAQAAKAARESRLRAQNARAAEAPSSFLAAAAVRAQDACPVAQVAAPEAEIRVDGVTHSQASGSGGDGGGGGGGGGAQADEADVGAEVAPTEASDAPRSAAYAQRVSRARTSNERWLREQAATAPAGCKVVPAPCSSPGSPQRSLAGAALVIGFASIVAIRVLRR